jgi:hypothetical protein
MDVALAGKIGIIESIEQNYEGEVQVAIVMENDPGERFRNVTAARPPLLLQD